MDSHASIREALESEIAENKRGPVANDPYWKGRLNGLTFARAILIAAQLDDCIPLDDVVEVASQEPRYG